MSEPFTSELLASKPFVVLCDMDGVVWLARRPLPKAADAVERLRSLGHRVVFVTNNSYATVQEHYEHLAAIGISADGDVVTSAMAAAFVVQPASNVLICGGPGLAEAVRARGAQPIHMSEYDDFEGRIDTVVVGFHRTFDYESLRRAHEAIRSGARFIASNEDATYPTPRGPIPGGGSIVAAVATASGVMPTVTGKPHATMATLVRSLVPGIDERTVMIGDRPSTDGRFAHTLGCRFALVHSDISHDEARFDDSDTSGYPSRIRVDFEGGSLWEVSGIFLGVR
jgi:HAD superfamily hydrolase (TIGR01450 family)